MTDLELLTADELSQLIKVGIGTLEQWRHRGEGPRFVKLGRLVRYRVVDVQDWVKEGWSPSSGDDDHQPTATSSQSRSSSDALSHTPSTRTDR